MTDIAIWQWTLLLGSSIGLYLLSPLSKNAAGFFKGKDSKNHAPALFLLTSSLVVSWIFAKSITNAANLGAAFGIVGGVAYGVYYFSFFVAGVLIYQMRTKGLFTSLHHFLRTRFGQGAVVAFSLMVGFRLFNEVWSNSAVIGAYFGAVGSIEYYLSIGGITFLTLLYALKGGFRSSLVTDLLQMIFFAFLLGALLVVLIPSSPEGIGGFISSGTWSWELGVNLIAVALLQMFSYPFHDPVMTDRGFVSDEKTTLKSFLLAGIIGFFAIVLFSFVGYYANQTGVTGSNIPAELAKSMGIGVLLLINFLMITSASSTLDSTFSSSAKLMTVDLAQKPLIKSVSKGRLVMILVAILGLLPLIATDEIIKATTVSGTMAIGLAPIFLFWKLKAPKISFYLSFFFGIIAGFILILGIVPESMLLTEGKYNDLLVVNLYGSIACFLGYLIPYFVSKSNAKNNS